MFDVLNIKMIFDRKKKRRKKKKRIFRWYG